MCVLTDHSAQRLKERCGSNKSSMQKTAETALEKGIQHSETSGSLKRYLDGLYLQHKNANNMRIWGDKLFLFCNVRLVTVLQVPTRYMKTCNKIRKQKGGDLYEEVTIS